MGVGVRGVVALVEPSRDTLRNMPGERLGGGVRALVECRAYRERRRPGAELERGVAPQSEDRDDGESPENPGSHYLRMSRQTGSRYRGDRKLVPGSCSWITMKSGSSPISTKVPAISS